MKIGIFTDTYEPQINGVVTSIKSSIEYLKEAHEIYIFCPKTKDNIKSTENIWRFPSIVYPFQQEYRLVLPFNKKVKKIEKLNLDIIHIHTPFTMGNIGVKVGKKLNIPMVHTYHTYFEKYLHYFPILPEKWMNKYARRESEKLCNACRLIITPTDEMKKELSKYNIDTPIHTLPSGIKEFKASKEKKENFIKEYKLENKTICVFVGRIGIEKNVTFLINSFEQLSKEVDQLHLLIIGDGPEKKRIIKLIKDKKLSNKITITGYLPKEAVFTGLNIAKIMLFPSKTETQGLTVVESLISGTPVIGINKMGVKNVIGNNKGGITTNEILTEYCNAALSLINNDEKYKEMCKEAKKRGQEFSIETTGKKLENLYKSLQ